MEASMFTNPFTSTAQDSLANQLQAFMALAHTAFDGGTKLLELNTNLGKARLEQSSIALRQLMMEGPQEYLEELKRRRHDAVGLQGVEGERCRVTCSILPWRATCGGWRAIGGVRRAWQQTLKK
jgi:hypothetical protein